MAARKQANRKGQDGIPSWVWILLAFLAGLILMAVLFMRGGKEGDFLLPQPNPDATPPTEVVDDDSAAVEDDTPNATDETKKTEFAFYDMLTDREVAIPDAELNARAEAEAKQVKQAETSSPDPVSPADTAEPTTIANNDPTPEPANTAQDAPATERYLLQAGAFKNNAQAEDLKARIALTGEIARIEAAEIKGSTVYRVRLGPYPNATSLAAAKEAISKQGIAVQAIRVK
jgi:cell division protein FtsN